MTDPIWITDTQPSSRFPVFTRMNAADVLPNPITPLGASMAWIPQILPGWAAGYADVGAFRLSELLSDESAVCGFFYGYLYVNQSSVRTVGIRLGIGWEAIDAAFFAGSDAPAHQPHPDDVDESLGAVMAERAQWAMTATEYPELEEARTLANAARAQRPALAQLSAAALVARARSLMPLQRYLWRTHTVASNQSAVGSSVIAQLLGEAAAGLMIRMIGTAGDVDSAAPAIALWDLSRIVRADAALTAAFDQGSTGLLERLAAEQPAFAARFQEFLHNFGYRGPGEWDIGTQAWESQPSLALSLVERLRQRDDDASPVLAAARSDLDTAEAMSLALALLETEEQKATLGLAVASARRIAAWRERSKTNCVKVLHEARMALLELGSRLVTQGHLTNPGQVFLVLDSELDLLIDDPASIVAILPERERNWRALFDLRPPMMIDGSLPLAPLADLPRRDADTLTATTPGEVLIGRGASAGRVTGRARIIVDTANIESFEPGEILVAPQTDPSWAPLFMVAAGVVVDTGALNSHAMIVSRELGIPCVAGVADASRRIPDGALLEVDGSTGIVTVLEPAAEPALN
ncbi:MAG TPA: PEP-utilizing enzyme [Kineosporiaceae bacterium]|nr:PEP-utilizing enzyme [Kineosporiaceae bacterium]